jgi:hypothetical protein
MKLPTIGLITLACVGGALGFGLVANAAIDLVISAPQKQVAAKPAEEAQPATAYALAATTSVPADIAPAKVKTITILFDESGAERAAAHAASAAPAAVPLPRPRPASAPTAMAMASDATDSISRQPGAMAISAATRRGVPDDGEVLGTAGIERMKTALALTAEQEEHWPAIAAELRALGKVLKANKSQGRLSVDDESIQRLYWAAAPLISRLSYEQKQKVKQMAHVMGLHQVAQAL